MLKYKEGNILGSDVRYIVQQVNCRGVIGAGLAKAIADRYLVVKTKYIELCRQHRPEDLLCLILPVQVEKDKVVLNVFAQLNYGRQNIVYTDYDALETAFFKIRMRLLKEDSQTIAFPYKFGCGCANGDWNIVSSLIERYFGDMYVEIWRLK